MVRQACGAAAALLVLQVAVAQAQPCAVRWTDATPAPDVDGSVQCMAVFDGDGPGSPGVPSLYVGGLFSVVSGVEASNIARWDGTGWSEVGSGTDGFVFAMAVFDDDGPGPNAPALYIGGNFTTAGGVAAEGVARWDGSTWSAVGAGLGGGFGGPRCLHVHDPDGPAGPIPPTLYAGGFFEESGPTAVPYIARWTGTAWVPVGTGTDGGVLALATYDEDGPGPQPARLFAGGMFSAAGGVTTIGIARWDGSAWSSVAGGFPGSPGGVVYSLAVFDEDGPGLDVPALIAGGSFESAGALAVSNLAKWDGADWADVGGGVSGGPAPTVTSLEVVEGGGSGAAPGLYVGGRFTSAGAVSAANIALWSGAGWAALGSGVDSPDALVSAVAAFDGPGGVKSLIVGGDLSSCGGEAVRNIARWNGAAWSALSVDLRITGEIRAMAAIDDDGPGPGGPALYVGGTFTRLGGVSNANLVRRSGAAWSAVGTGVNGPVSTIVALPGAGALPGAPGIVVGGLFSLAGAQAASNVAVWNGAAWSALGSGVNGEVRAAAVYDPDGAGPAPASLIVGGAFSQSGGTPVARIARWDGSSWQGLGSGLAGGEVYSMVVYDPDGPGPSPPQLIVGGDFTTAGGVPAGRIARWDGAAWSALGTGVTLSDAPAVNALCVLDETPFGMARRVVIAGGRFGQAGGVAAGRVARWDGSGWSALGGGLPGLDSDVRALVVYDDDGPGPGVHALYAAGYIQSPGRWLSRWNGTAWGAVGSGISGTQPVLALAAIDRDRAGPIAPELNAGGALGLRIWSACDAACAGDYDRNGAVQPADVTLFVATWFADLLGGGAMADADNNGAAEPIDVALFVRSWYADISGSCP